MLTVVAMALGIGALSMTGTLTGLGVAPLLAGAASGALEVCLDAATARAERMGGRPLFQAVHAASPLSVIATAPLTGPARQSGPGIRVVLLLSAAALLGSVLPLLAPAAADRPDDRAHQGVRRLRTARVRDLAAAPQP
ncbi:hypothetical protein [Streptomyces sp. VRA16 Mangrove soil]|uniref:hypothetical protein n=1 Tax=Streptomyces sp. VRA16 Mangrove soil TaxID=2817434 RepID=UPI001A9FD6B1|nr:hypothetical protein [Streptomyces sp. VRA16 Mangrove soil]MBO1330236.1 hypothetical protein [Streptomyces sp. VRA16 Mangrove soil]